MIDVSNLDDVVYNGIELDAVIFNGNVVWEKTPKIVMRCETAGTAIIANKWYNAINVKLNNEDENQIARYRTYTYSSVNVGDTITVSGEFSSWYEVSDPFIKGTGTYSIIKMPSMSKFCTKNGDNLIAGNYFFYKFNYNGKIISLPPGSFDTSNITSVGADFFYGFNWEGGLTSLPEGSFKLNNITSVGDDFFYGFNFYGKLISLPSGSFNIDNITSVGRDFFYGFNYYGFLTSLPSGSFNTSNITSVGRGFFEYFNECGSIQYSPAITETKNITPDPINYDTDHRSLVAATGDQFKWLKESEILIKCETSGTAIITNKWNHTINARLNSGSENQIIEGNSYTYNSVISGDIIKISGMCSSWNQNNNPFISGTGTYSIIQMASMSEFCTKDNNGHLIAGDYFFYSFNKNGSLTSLPSGSFDTYDIVSVGDYFFSNFNNNGLLTSLPGGSFNTSNITNTGNHFFENFNTNGTIQYSSVTTNTINPTSSAISCYAGNQTLSVDPNGGQFKWLKTGDLEIVIRCETAGTAIINNKWNKPINVKLNDGYENRISNGDAYTYDSVVSGDIIKINGTLLSWNAISKPFISGTGKYSIIQIPSMEEFCINDGEELIAVNNLFSYFNSRGSLISLPSGSFNTINITSVEKRFFFGFNGRGKLTSLPANSFKLNNITSVGDDFFESFNSSGSLTSLPEGSFNTSNITSVGGYFFADFNNNGSLTSLPANSFKLNNITNVGYGFFNGFNDSGSLTSLPANSFNISNITSVGDYFFENFNGWYGNLTSLPSGSFDTSNITSVGRNFFNGFNKSGSLISLPANSFKLNKIKSVGDNFFESFNSSGSLTSLPSGSFNTSNITSVGGYFFASFNSSGSLTSLPSGSFNTSNITSAGWEFFYNFNNNGSIRYSSTTTNTKNMTSSAISYYAGGSTYTAAANGGQFKWRKS